MDRPILRKEKKVVHIWCHSVEQLYTTPCTYGGKADKEANSRKYKQKAPADMSFIREKTYTLPSTQERGLRIRARTKKGKTRRKEKPGGAPSTPGGVFLSRKP